jgi:hypothetical protein
MPAFPARPPAVTLTLLRAARQSVSKPFRNPINDGPIPFFPHHPGRYDLTTTQGNTIRIWTLPTRDGLKPAQPVTVWSDNTPSRCRSIRAAELHSPGRPRWTAPVPERHR